MKTSMPARSSQLDLLVEIDRRVPRELILASAGSGKTFRISSQLIALLARGERPDDIFASTFTRKAAGEILDRVLVRLADASLDSGEAAELAGHAGVADAGAADRGFWLSVLERTVRQLHRVNVGTLDAFFVRAVRSFALDLGLPVEWRIADAPAQVRLHELALQDVLGAAEPHVLVELVRAIARGRAARSVHDALLRQVGDLTAAHYAVDPAADDAWGGFGDVVDADVSPDARKLLAARIAAAEPPRTQQGAPHTGFATALVQAAERVRTADWGAFVSSTLCRAAVTGTDYSRHAVSPPIRQLFEEACAMARAELTVRFAAQSRALEAFTRLYVAALERRRRDSGLYGFDDLTRAMGGPDPLAARPDLFYRLDARTKHILLDEFQDTSAAQWEALQPLLEELMAGYEGERAAVIVADPKQSIYGWRGGSPELVDMVRRRFGLGSDVLARSWRSSPVVLDVVNAVFGSLPDLPIWDDDAARGVACAWSAAFSPHVAARPALAGHVRISAGPADDGGEARPNLCRHAAERVAALHDAAPDRSIGVLTRRNETVARIMFELKCLGVRASEEGGNALTDDAAVASVLALLRLADHPGNGVVRYHVAKTPAGAALGYADHSDDGATYELSNSLRRRLLDDGYGRTIADLTARLGASCSARERRRLAQLVELAFRYEPDATLRPSDFVRWVDAQRVEDPAAAAVRVMTVHQAKGLEFDIVVLPELDAPLVKPAIAPLAYRPSPTARVTKVFPYVSVNLLPLFTHIPELAQAAGQARAAALRDALSTMYVAMTRARHALHIVVRPDGENGPGGAKTSARILREALFPGARDAADGDVLYEHGDPAWYQAARAGSAVWAGSAACAASATPRSATRTAALRQDSRRTRVLPRLNPSALEGGEHTDLALVLTLGAAASRERGSIVHLWFEQVGWIEDGVPSAADLSRLARRVTPDRAVQDPAGLTALAARFDGWINVPAIRTLLSRASYPPDARVETEVPFIHRDGDALVEGVIDRLVTIRKNGVVTAAEIVDYKTDTIPAGDADLLARRREYYAPQLEAYRRAVAAMFSLTTDRVSALLVFVEAAAVVDAAGGKAVAAAPRARP